MAAASWSNGAAANFALGKASLACPYGPEVARTLWN